MRLPGERDLFDASNGSFNMTPLIDIVFLLIIFFVVVSTFIDAENFAVLVPDDCDKAVQMVNDSGAFITVTVMVDSNGSSFAVGGKIIDSSDEEQLSETLLRMIDEQLGVLTSDERVVALRIDGQVPFSLAQYALIATSKSTATDIQLAVLQHSR